MGGTNEKRVAGLRVHVSGRQVHLHDDSSGRKFSTTKRTLQKELDDFQRETKRSDGVKLVDGSSGTDTLLLGKTGSKTFVSVVSQGTDVADLKRWAASC